MLHDARYQKDKIFQRGKYARTYAKKNKYGRRKTNRKQ